MTLDYTNTVSCALELVDLGIPVFPAVLEGTDKVPAIADWRRNATTDEQQIHAWFTGAHYLIGTPTGQYFDAVDVDPRHGGDQWLAANKHQLPTTRWHQTLQNGLHLLFRHHPGMRNSVNKIAPGVDVRGEGGFVVHWPGHGLPAGLDKPIAPWPDWLAEQAMKGRARRLTGKVALDTRKPPSAQHVASLLDRMPNPLEVTRDTYCDVMLAAKGCIDALIEAGELDDFDEEARIIDAAIGWATRWEGNSATDEAAKWDEDWAHRSAPLAGWQTLTRIAESLIPEYRQERVAEEFGPTPPYEGNPAWRKMLHVSKAGTIKACLDNALIAFDHAPEWQGRLAYNSFANIITLSQKPLKDSDAIWAASWLQRRGSVFVGQEIAGQALLALAERQTFHPVRDYLATTKWDRTPRVDTMLIDHFGVADTPLHRAYSSCFLISAVARVMRPGCKVDMVLILEGRQALLKSTALKTLAGEWFTDHVPDLSTKDAQLQLQGKWIVEFAELGQFGRADANRAKIFISTANDRLRKPYGRVVEDFPRQCVLAVTLNAPADGYLKDETGNRRFMPVRCGEKWPAKQRIDIAKLAAVRDQLWAEAVCRFNQGEAWWLTNPALEQAQVESTAERLQTDPWHEKIEEYLCGKDEVTAEQIFTEGLGVIAARNIDHLMKVRVGRVLTALGWSRSWPRGKADPKRRIAVYRRSEE